jgi:hypothetical protein
MALLESPTVPGGLGRGGGGLGRPGRIRIARRRRTPDSAAIAAPVAAPVPTPVPADDQHDGAAAAVGDR